MSAALAFALGVTCGLWLSQYLTARARRRLQPYVWKCTRCGDFKVASNDLEAMEVAISVHQESGECHG